MHERDLFFTGWMWHFDPEDADYTERSWEGWSEDEMRVMLDEWLDWLHGSMKGRKFDLPALQQQLRPYAAVLAAILSCDALPNALSGVVTLVDRVKELLLRDIVATANGDFRNLDMRPLEKYAGWLAPDWDRSLSDETRDALQLVKTAGTPTTAVEDLDVAKLQQALHTLQPLIQTWKERRVVLLADTAELEQKAKRRPIPTPAADPSYERVHPGWIEASGHTAILYEREPWTGADLSPAVLLTSATFEAFVDGSANALVGILSPQAGVGIRLRELQSLRRCIELYMPAIARLLEQQRRDDPSASSRPPLRFGLLNLYADNQLDPNWRWISCSDYQRALSIRQRPGCFLLYPARQQPQHAPLQYVMFDSPLSRPENVGEFDLDRAELDTALQWPTLSELIRFVHGSIKGDTFDLQAVLDEADRSGLQAASEALARMERLDFLYSRACRLHARVMTACHYDWSGSSPFMTVGCAEPEIKLNDLQALDVPRIQTLLQPFDEMMRTLQSALAGQPDRPPLPPPEPRKGRDVQQLRRAILQRMSHSRHRLELMLPAADAAEGSSGRWSAYDVLRVLNRHCILQHQKMTDLSWWPMLDVQNDVVLGARLSVFRAAAAADPASCTAWYLVFQLVVKDNQSTQGAFLRLFPVASRSLMPAESSRWSLQADRQTASVINMIGGSTWPLQLPPVKRSRDEPLPPSVVPHTAVEPWETEAVIAAASTGPDGKVTVAATVVPIGQSTAWYAERGVRLHSPPDVTRIELFDALLHEHKERVLCSAAELQSMMQNAVQAEPAAAAAAASCQLLLQTDSWYHRDPADPLQLPGDILHFRSLAQLVSDGDLAAHHARLAAAVAFDPSQQPNTHRSHWFNAGTDWSLWLDPYSNYVPMDMRV